MDDLNEVLNSAFDGDAGDQGETIAADAPETEVLNASDDTESQADATPEDGEPAFNSAEFLKQHPEMEPWARQMMRDYTQKTQDLAEQRKQFEGLDEGTVAAIRYVNELAARDPKAAADWLAQQAEALRGTPAPEPYAEMEFATDAERVAFERIARLEQQLQQQQIVGIHADVERRFEQLAQAHGEIPANERQRTIDLMVMQGVPLPALETFWRGQNVERLIAGASRKARDEASAVVQRKAGIGSPPSGVAAREAAGTREPQSLQEALEMAIS